MPPVNVATLTAKVMIQVADGDPVEVGTIDIPIHFGTTHAPAKREPRPLRPFPNKGDQG
ncbi:MULTISPECIES: hypothetical protein [unclassified Microbacterium]|uniref:hypothetical protein n=1 Tax=Microbacterium TaxID=33882 RepID=UPI003B9F2150